jgi:hypothetical protein
LAFLDLQVLPRLVQRIELCTSDRLRKKNDIHDLSVPQTMPQEKNRPHRRTHLPAFGWSKRLENERQLHSKLPQFSRRKVDIKRSASTADVKKFPRAASMGSEWFTPTGYGKMVGWAAPTGYGSDVGWAAAMGTATISDNDNTMSASTACCM